MISVGAKVRFCQHYTKKEYADVRSITGTISYVNWNHKVFTVEYQAGGTTQIEAFKFFDIGNAVTICK